MRFKTIRDLSLSYIDTQELVLCCIDPLPRAKRGVVAYLKEGTMSDCTFCIYNQDDDYDCSDRCKDDEVILDDSPDSCNNDAPDLDPGESWPGMHIGAPDPCIACTQPLSECLNPSCHLGLKTWAIPY
jgi:hypothetical protein